MEIKRVFILVILFIKLLIEFEEARVSDKRISINNPINI